MGQPGTRKCQKYKEEMATKKKGKVVGKWTLGTNPHKAETMSEDKCMEVTIFYSQHKQLFNNCD
jgi:hypothetical protein